MAQVKRGRMVEETTFTTESKIRGLLEDVERECLVFESRDELARFLSQIAMAKMAFAEYEEAVRGDMVCKGEEDGEGGR